MKSQTAVDLRAFKLSLPDFSHAHISPLPFSVSTSFSEMSFQSACLRFTSRSLFPRLSGMPEFLLRRLFDLIDVRTMFLWLPGPCFYFFRGRSLTPLK